MKRRKRGFKATISATVLALLCGCGGGGGDVPSVPSFEDAYDIGRIFFFLLTGSGRWTVGGIGSDGAFYEITISFEPDGDSFFPLTPGLPGTRSKQTTTLRRNGVLIATVNETTFFTLNTLAIQGTTRSDGTCSQVSAATPPPASAEPGNGGSLDASIDYTSCTSGAPVTGTTSRTWSVEAGNTPVDFLTVYFCSNETTTNPAGQVVATESICLEINRDGTLDDKARVTRTGPGNFSLTARN